VPNGFVIPAKAGIQFLLKPFWIPACAGMTVKKIFQRAKVLQKNILGILITLAILVTSLK
jgi:hypothetical protein